jgi:hypothetical protein
MKKTVLFALSLALFFLPACNKNNASSAGTGTTNDSTISGGTLQLNLNSSEPNWPSSIQANIELIVSEPTGKVLLDTITPVNTRIEISPRPSTSSNCRDCRENQRFSCCIYKSRMLAAVFLRKSLFLISKC